MRPTIALSIALLLIAANVHGAASTPTSTNRSQYRWQDSAGTPHYSDMLTPEALQSGYDILNGKGAVVKHVERQRTPEELFAEEAAAQQAAAAKRVADAQAVNDKRMLAAYPTETDLISARQAQLDGIDQNIKAANNSLGAQERGLSEALARAASFDHENKPVPDVQQKQIESLRKSIDALRAYVARRQTEKIEANKKLETDLAHYREAKEHNSAAQP